MLTSNNSRLARTNCVLPPGCLSTAAGARLIAAPPHRADVTSSFHLNQHSTNKKMDELDQLFAKMNLLFDAIMF